MEVVDKIKVMPTSAFSAEFPTLPRPYVVIEKVTLVEAGSGQRETGRAVSAPVAPWARSISRPICI